MEDYVGESQWLDDIVEATKAYKIDKTLRLRHDRIWICKRTRMSNVDNFRAKILGPTQIHAI